MLNYEKKMIEAIVQSMSTILPFTSCWSIQLKPFKCNFLFCLFYIKKNKVTVNAEHFV